MKKLLTTSLVFASFSIAPGVLAQASGGFNGAEIEEVVNLSVGHTLRLKGSAVASKARQSVYIGGLYLQNDATSAAILNPSFVGETIAIHARTNKGGKLEEGSVPGGVNNFQGRYVIRHAWEGELACEDPQRGRWGGPPANHAAPDVLVTGRSADARRGNVTLTSFLAQDIPAIGAGPATGRSDPEAHESGAEEEAVGSQQSSLVQTPAGCGGCSSGRGPTGGAEVFWLIVATFFVRRR